MSDLTYLPCSAAAFGGFSAEILHPGRSLRFRVRWTSMRPGMRSLGWLAALQVDALAKVMPYLELLLTENLRSQDCNYTLSILPSPPNPHIMDIWVDK